jgi:HPt (histidine-containing phosphotransfer) domain-containing protein
MADTFEQYPPFELSRLEREYADAPDILSEILAIFTEETPERLHMLREGIREDDPARVQKAAHSLANTSGTLMAERALKLARATEESARAADLPTMRKRAEILAAEIERMRDQIESARNAGTI